MVGHTGSTGRTLADDVKIVLRRDNMPRNECACVYVVDVVSVLQEKSFAGFDIDHQEGQSNAVLRIRFLQPCLKGFHQKFMEESYLITGAAILEEKHLLRRTVIALYVCVNRTASELCHFCKPC